MKVDGGGRRALAFLLRVLKWRTTSRQSWTASTSRSTASIHVSRLYASGQTIAESAPDFGQSYASSSLDKASDYLSGEGRVRQRSGTDRSKARP